MSNIVTTGNMPPPVQQSFNYKLLAIKLPDFIHTLPAALKEMPRNGGTTMRFRRFDRLPPALQPLGNTGAPIPPTPLNATDIDKICVDVKFSLIDLELCYADNKAQA